MKDDTTIFKICIVKLSAMGDIIHAMAALQFMKKAYPNARIDWIVEEGFQSVLENNPDIDTLLPINLKSIKKHTLKIFSQIKILQEYAQNNYDVVIDAQGLLKSAIVAKIVGRGENNATLIGFDKNSTREGIASYLYDKKISIPYEENVIKRNIAVLCTSLDIPVTSDNILQKKSFLFSNSTKKREKSIIFVVGASKENKIYPKEKFLDLAHELREEIVVVWGSEEERNTALWLSSQSNFIKIAPQGSLDDLKQIICESRLVVGGDTGPTHMAWALNIPSITIFGNTPEYRNTYITSINRVIKSESVVDPLKLDKNDFSIVKIAVSDIKEIALELLV